MVSLLKMVGVHKRNQLTPKCQKLYSYATQMIKKAKRCGSRKTNFKDRLRAAENLTDSYLAEKFSNKMTASVSLFTRLQLRETNKSSHGHRFTIDEKMLSLSLYKRSPKCYRLLSKLFSLPSKRTLNTILTSVSIRTGICPHVINILKENVKKLKPAERYCSILFDEVCLSSGLQYTPGVDEIDGFVDIGSFKSQELADHALVFMIRGIKKKFKQPVAYSFCQATHQNRLVQQNYYLQINGDYRDDVYEVEIVKNGISERVKIVYLFDVPHLMKCIRNNLLNKDLNFTIDGVKRTAKWDHLIQLYKEDSEIPDSKMLPRLTDCHILPHKITKMKVKCATQVFSQRVSAVLNFLADKNIINSSAVDTAVLLLFFDKLFDSFNGSFDKIVEGKIFRTAVKKNSVHHKLWADSLKVLSSMIFVGKTRSRLVFQQLRIG
ncbi:Uncharacterized protein FWK35_00009537 [Aphis craccivora]|uniref:THAP-type domain-containing protein n=1 Tax=Aphis craccivora TaxID=307492 RepID=A0A6G0YGQ9_APHCR|nr:Uncharacterized protein FWK35_00009537 [Aphis craccivora]